MSTGHTMSKLESEERGVREAVRYSPISFVLTDPRLADNPITYVNEAFEAMTLYSREYAIGRNCRFLQGPQTDPRDVERIRRGLQTKEEFQVTITNHRADGTPFRNQLLIAPIRRDNGELSAFFAVQHELDIGTSVGLRHPHAGSLSLLQELQHRVKNHLAMVVSMIRIQAKRQVTPDSLKAVSRRIEALALLYDELFNGGEHGDGNDQILAAAYLARIAHVVARLDAREGIHVDVECDDISLPVDQAARLGLLLSEFVTNALEHAFDGRTQGIVIVRLFRFEGQVRLVVEDDGVGMPEGSDWPFAAPSVESQRDRARHGRGRLDTTGHGREAGVGGSIVAALSQSLGASVRIASSQVGTSIIVDFDPHT